jgi:hypothetical protein
MRRPDLPWRVVTSIKANPRQVVIIGLFSLFSVIYFSFSSRMFSIASIRSIDDSNQHSHNGKLASQKKMCAGASGGRRSSTTKTGVDF